MRGNSLLPFGIQARLGRFVVPLEAAAAARAASPHEFWQVIAPHQQLHNSRTI